MGLFNSNQMGIQPYRNNTGLKILFFTLSLVIGLYFLNAPFSFVKMPETILGFQNWIIFAGGILVIIGAVNYIRLRRRY